jgi:membrane protease YdiL (CAAX protease family)
LQIYLKCMNNELEQRPAPIENTSDFAQFSILIGFFLLFLGLFAIIGVVCILGISHLSVFDLKAKEDAGDFSNPLLVQGLIVAQIISEFGTFILPAIVFAFLASRKRLDYLSLNRLGKMSTLLLGGLLMWCALPLINIMSEWNSHMVLPPFMSSIENWMKNAQQTADKLTEAFMAHQSFSGMLVSLFMIGVLAPIAEELFFRAVLQKIMIKWTNSIHWGVWISGILFSALHFEFYGFLPRMLMGVYLGYLFVWSGSIWVPIFAHFLNNGTAVIFQYLEDRGNLPKNFDQVGTQASEWTYVVGSAVIVAVLMFLIYRIEHRKAETIPS